MKEFIDLYAVLGVSPEAKQHEIEKAYKLRLFEIRPDLNLDDTTRRQFELLQIARNTLSDPMRNTAYYCAYHQYSIDRFSNWCAEAIKRINSQEIF
jgi:DnaJ-class molecular chaperone